MKNFFFDIKFLFEEWFFGKHAVVGVAGRCTWTWVVRSFAVEIPGAETFQRKDTPTAGHGDDDGEKCGVEAAGVVADRADDGGTHEECDALDGDQEGDGRRKELQAEEVGREDGVHHHERAGEEAESPGENGQFDVGVGEDCQEDSAINTNSFFHQEFFLQIDRIDADGIFLLKNTSKFHIQKIRSPTRAVPHLRRLNATELMARKIIRQKPHFLGMNLKSENHPNPIRPIRSQIPMMETNDTASYSQQKKK